jgi:hypothetical protein
MLQEMALGVLLPGLYGTCHRRMVLYSSILLVPGPAPNKLHIYPACGIAGYRIGQNATKSAILTFMYEENVSDISR